MRKIWKGLLCVLLLICLLSANVRAASCGDSLSWTLEDGVLTVSGTGSMSSWTSAGAVPWYSSRSAITSAVIGEGVTDIGNYAFYNCASLTSLTLPDSLTAIGRNAFQGCKSLTEVTIPDEVTDIGSAAFYDCTGLTTLTIGSNVIAIGDEAFFGCTGLTTLTIPGSVSEIGLYAFADCKSLTGIWVDEANQAYSSDDAGCLFNKNKTELIMAPLALSGVYHVPQGVTDIGFEAFFECAGLVGLTIPDSVTAIGDYAFYGCEALSHITYSGLAAEWDYIAIGTDNTCLLTVATKHCDAEADTVYSYQNCVSSGMFCGICNDFITMEDAVAGSHSYEDIEDMDCQSCGYVRALSSLVLQQQPTTLEYALGTGVLDTAGGLLKATFSDGSSGTVEIKSTMVSGFDNTKLGSQTLTVTWGGKTVSYSVTVALGTPDSLTVVTLPDRVDYLVGSQPDLTGLTLSAVYKNYGTVTVTAEQVGMDTVDMTTPGRKTVTVRVKDGTAAFEILVHNKASLTVDASLYPESSHNYASNTDETKSFSCPGAFNLTLTFDSQSYVENGYDFIYVYDGQGTLVKKLTGKLYNEILTVSGDTVKIRLTSDGSSNRYGYAFASIAADIKEHSYEQGYCTVCGQLQYAVAVMENGAPVGGGETVAQAMQYYGANGQYLKLYTDQTVDISLCADLYVDLNGHSLSGVIIANGYQVFGMDTTTDGYSAEKIGWFTCTDENGEAIVPVTHFKFGGKRYMSIKDDKGYSFHRFYLGLTHQTLKPTVTGLGFKAVFCGDAMVQSQLDSYGYTLCLGNYSPRTFANSADSFQSGKTVTLRIDNYDVEKHGETPLYASAVLKLTDGTVIESAQCTVTLRGLLETVNDNYQNYEEPQLTLLREMIEKYTVIQSWKVENLI